MFWVIIYWTNPAYSNSKAGDTVEEFIVRVCLVRYEAPVHRAYTVYRT